MFDAIVQPKPHDREDLFQPVSGTPVTTNILDIRSNTGKAQLQESLRQGIEAACRGKAAMPDLLLWDDKGLRYFEDVTYSPDYYLTDEEIGILESQRHNIANQIPAGTMLVELGSGYEYASASNVRSLTSSAIYARSRFYLILLMNWAVMWITSPWTFLLQISSVVSAWSRLGLTSTFAALGFVGRIMMAASGCSIQ